MTDVLTTRPTNPDETSDSRIEIAELTAVFPSSRVQSSRFPLFLRGISLLAYSRSLASPP